MNDESYLFGKKDILEERLLYSKTRARDAKMDEEENTSTCNKRAKRIGVQVDSEDDEPIGSLLKLKKSRNPKKVKSGLKSELNVGKVEKTQVKTDKSSAKDEKLGEMDDTLASFWMKLKGPKIGKDVGSGTRKGKGSASNGEEFCSKQVEESPTCSGDCSDLLVDRVLEGKTKGPVKRSRLAALSIKVGNHSELGEFDQDSGVQKSQKESKKKMKEQVSALRESCTQSSDENLDFSLSAFLRKSQSNSARKSLSSSTQKKKRETQASVDELAKKAHSSSSQKKKRETHHPFVDELARKARSRSTRKKKGETQASASEFARKPRFPSTQKKKRDRASVEEFAQIPDVALECASPRLIKGSRSTSVESKVGSTMAPDGTLEEPAIVQEAAETSRSFEGPCPASRWIQDYTVSEPVQELASLLKVATEILSSNDARCSISTQAMLRDRIPTSPLPRTSSGSVTDLGDQLATANNEQSNRGPNTPKEHLVNYDVLHQPCGAGSKDIIFQQVLENDGEETQGLINGLIHCSKVKETKILENEGEGPSKISESHFSPVMSTSGEVNAIFNGVLTEPSKSNYPASVCFSNEATVPEGSCAMSGEQSLVPFFGDDILNRVPAGKCDENSSNHHFCLNQLSLDVYEELSSRKSFSMSTKLEGEATARLDELAQLSGENAENQLVHPLKKSSIVGISPKREEAPKPGESGQCFYDSLKAPDLRPLLCAPTSPSASGSFKDENGTDLDKSHTIPSSSTTEPLAAQSLKQVAETCRSNDGLHSNFASSDRIKDIDSYSPNNHKEDFRPIGAVNVAHHLPDSSSPIYISCSQKKEPSVASIVSPAPSQDGLPFDEKVNATCSQSIKLESKEAFPEDAGKAFDLENEDKQFKATQRAVRKVKKRRHGDMAYEGDTNWDFLIHAQGLFANRDLFNGDRPSRDTDKCNYSNVVMDAEHCGEAAAVAAGLKARVVCPFEKIKFKEILKRRGGLQEYLECRNSILGLWSKDTSRILSLSDCGITDVPSNSDPPRASLVREIYDFLDHNGYINAGIASEKQKAECYVEAHHKLDNERETEESSGVRVGDSDGVPFILGQVSERPTESKTDTSENEISQATKCTEPVPSMGSETRLIRSEEHLIVPEQKNGWLDAKLLGRAADADADALANFPGEVVDTRPDLVVGPDMIVNSHGIQSVVVDPIGGDNKKQQNSKVQQRIIVIGAGPAGLTAARHMQRQGFSVTILEARNRLGGRVYTDHSSLSVPVDLGASIITGVEADVATERRPDPSTLVCSQLGLELTVLNSDCPLYDTVTGQKVPQELDEALEAEYNSLLDDMIVLVEQNGDRAMRMSLEDGLEYELKKRRMSGPTSDAEDFELDTLANASCNGHEKTTQKETLSPLERRVMNWHFAHLEYGCAALLKDVSLPNWNQDDVYGGFGGAHCMIKGGYSNVMESLGKGLHIQLNHVVTEVSYRYGESNGEVKVSTSNGSEFVGDAVLVTVPLGCLKANTIKFSPSLPDWKQSSILQLGFGVLNKVVLEFPEVFWDDTVDYFGATAEETDHRGHCFMFWNVKKTVGAPVLIALVVGKAALDGESMSSNDHVNHALKVLRKLFGIVSVPDPVASVVTNWGQDPFSRGAYSYVAVGASGEDYDILGRPVENCLFFAGEATCKEHPDTVGGAMMSGLREAVRIIDILSTGKDYTAEVEEIEASQRQTESERNEVRDILKRLESIKYSNALFKSTLDGSHILTKESLLQDMFHNAKTTKGRLHLAKELLNLPVKDLKSFAGTREGLNILNSWILDSMGKDGTQLLRHCVRLLVLVSTDLLAVRLSGIGRTVKEKVCVHTSRDIRAVASQLVSMWIEVFRKEKAANGGLKLLRQSTLPESSKTKSSRASFSGKHTRTAHGTTYNRGKLRGPSSPGKNSPSNTDNKKTNSKLVRMDTVTDMKSEGNSLHSQEVLQDLDSRPEDNNVAISEEEAAVFAAAEAARAAALAAAEAYASSEADRNALRDLPKIPSFHKFARREQYAQMDDSEFRKRWSGGVLGRQDCLSEIDSRNCKVQNWTVDFSAACANLDTSRMSGDNYTQKSHSTEVGYQMNLREHSGESAPTDSRITKAWVDSAGSGGVKDYQDIDRWQSQAAAVDPDFFHHTVHIRDEEDSSAASKPESRRYDKGADGSAASQDAENQFLIENQTRGVDRIKKAVVDYVGSLLMPLYKARKIDREGYKSIMKKSATKVMEQTTDVEKAMNASEFLDFKRKNKIRAFVDKLIEKHMSTNTVKS